MVVGTVGVVVVGAVGTLVDGVVTAGSPFSPQPDVAAARTAAAATTGADSRLPVRVPHTGA